MNVEDIEKRPIPGFEGMYSATSDGRIISEERYIYHPTAGKTLLPEKCLRAGRARSGHETVAICLNGKPKSYFVHRLVGAAFGLIDLYDKKQQIDHIDNQPSNNRLQNLRASNQSQNMAWGAKYLNCNNTSGYRGVTWCKRRKKWQAQLGCMGKNHWLGDFDDKHEAAAAYDEAAVRLFGEFARLNLKQEAA